MLKRVINSLNFKNRYNKVPSMYGELNLIYGLVADYSKDISFNRGDLDYLPLYNSLDAFAGEFSKRHYATVKYPSKDDAIHDIEISGKSLEASYAILIAGLKVLKYNDAKIRTVKDCDLDIYNYDNLLKKIKKIHNSEILLLNDNAARLGITLFKVEK